jgi:iron complex outermembrane receptor protein
VTFDGRAAQRLGNYALFTNQMLDPELVDRVDVNLGTTDVDSPTASATGGTVAYRTRKPTDDFSSELVLSAGDHNYQRGFLRVDTGEWSDWGTKAFSPRPTRTTTSSRVRANSRRSRSTP